MHEGKAGLISAERRLEEPRPALWFLRIAFRSLWAQLGVRCMLGTNQGSSVGRSSCLSILDVWYELLWAWKNFLFNILLFCADCLSVQHLHAVHTEVRREC